MNDVARAEQYERHRAVVLGLMGATLGFGLFLAVRSDAASDDHVAFGLPVYAVRIAIAALAAMLIATGGGPMKPSRVLAMANDEATRRNRRRSIAIGFWTMLAIGVVGYLSSFGDHAIPVRLLARLFVDGGEAAALIAFAVLEVRTAR